MAYTLEQLNAFALTKELGSFQKAAQAMGKHRTSVSALVGNLEDELNCELFERGSRSLELTEQGRALYQSARSVITESQMFETQVAGVIEGAPSDFTLAVVPILKDTYLLREMQRLTERFPSMQLHVLTGDAEQVLNWVNKGQADLGYAYDYRMFSQQLSRAELYSLETCLVGRADKLDEADQNVAAWMRANTQIMYYYQSDDWQRTAHRFSYVNDPQTALELILMGIGWGGIPYQMARPYLDSGELKELQPSAIDKREFVSIIGFWRSNMPLNPAAEQLLQALSKIS
ncbi:LysR family transcriptional regulator [Paraferrimonas sedimenticola]|uniref:LysR family transcriptional regulator n=1 Tax=Paraferrimonas sedimenticola TaxID=375674 RepID=A0AA37RUS1_9GAMM|nr:LysR family transcriptional regulator [Paraferrimonas sedimenticola]GLP95704.1 LysR family transcriptional regulator [Paraferrimonas sedimenticola]